MGIINTLLLIGFAGIVCSGIAISTYLIGTEGTKRWIVYPIFCIVCFAIFLFFKHTMIPKLLPWRNAYLIISYYVPLVCSLSALIAIPKKSLKALIEHVLPAISIFAIFGVLLVLF